ncbi:zinc-binding dehydrogenase [Planotetraspora sp. A-T 1434]|uniref:zinc-binding dehydrogenase n=1 Tax=Planotetraspora sp. A-T 1434 TaxID=2979219 RepID=UPI0021C20A3B|nr:zinc-binding dehydrogenase [Planotetraspora sp. A-T 1434]MCT9933249.1 zinc-binding dehydrogenase [Planotetraspora sp. A-T 1434]
MGVGALVVNSDASGMRMGEIPDPVPQPNEALVDVRHVSINHGDLRVDVRPPGTVLGCDASGVVARAAADGSGPAAGTRVVAFSVGAWARRIAVGTNELAEVPASIDLAHAAALPLAGITALRTLRAAGPILGRRVLVTGASGGVGRMAVQLAAHGGAHVIASVGTAERGEGLAALGAHEVVVGLDGIDRPVDLILDNVGGPQLVAAWGLLAPGGNVQSIGWVSGEPAVFPPYSTFSLGAARTLSSFGDASDVGPDLATLVDLVATGALVIEVGWRGPWDRVDEAADALAGRRLAGKAVLDVY